MIPIARPWLDEQEVEATAAVLRSGWVGQGKEVAAFEAELGTALAVEDTLVVSSGTAALHLLLIATGVGPGDDVVVPSLSFIATANSARYVGARPVFADVDAATQNLTAETVAAAWTPATRAVVVVDQVGMPCDLTPLQALCRERGAVLVQDAACALGSTYRGRPVGADNPLVAFSFHPRKVITTGEGGALVCRDAALMARLRRLRQHAVDVDAVARAQAGDLVFERYAEVGYNYRMTDVQAAIGRVQLRRLATIVERRRALAATYHEQLRDCADLELPADPAWGTSNYQSYAVRLRTGGVERRNDLLRFLLERGVSARRGIPAVHREPAYADSQPGPLPQTERWADLGLMLPLYPQLFDTEVDAVAAAVREGVRR